MVSVLSRRTTYLLELFDNESELSGLEKSKEIVATSKLTFLENFPEIVHDKMKMKLLLTC